MKIINLNTWKRKEHFGFFSKFDEPFFGLVSDIDCTEGYAFVKKNGLSFFAWYLHKALIAANSIEEFRYRYDGENVMLYEAIHASPTLARENGTFGFGFLKFTLDFNIFWKQLEEETKAVKNSTGLRLNHETNLKNVFHFSSVPWIKFTGLSHAIDRKMIDSVPKISFGKTFNNNDKIYMPVSVFAHHGFVDGLHVANFLEKFEELINN